MFLHPETILVLAHQRQRELIADADRSRLLASARRGRRERGGRAGRHAAERAAPAGTLAPCGPRAAAPAR